MIFQHNISLRKFNTFGIEAKAEHFASVASTEDIIELLDNKEVDHRKLFVLGGGSNILLTRDLTGTVLKNEIPGIDLVAEDGEHVYVKAGAGINWHSFVQYCLEHNYAGVENLALIPGNVGASPMQNIGAYGVELKDVFNSLETLHIKDKQVVTFTKDACKFGYRDSIFKNEYRNQFIITSVTFALLKKPVFQTSYGALQQELDKANVEISIQSIAAAVMRIRRSKLPDPTVIGNAGSFFKNPTVTDAHFNELVKASSGLSGFKSDQGYKLAAGWLIEQCGWKGYRRGDAGCHAQQALVLVNYGRASGNEIVALSKEVIESVQRKFNIVLETEVNII